MTPEYARLAALASCKTSSGRAHIKEVWFHPGYAEPGYSDPPDGLPVATGNWNTVTRWDEVTRAHVTIDEAPKRLADILERMGCALEWSDEWRSCGQCGRIFRTQPDSYSWTMSSSIEDGEACCADCIDPAAHLEALERNALRCNTVSAIDPADHDYILFSADHETGFHLGQDADPKAVAATLEALGATRYLFNLDCVGQFDARWSCYVHESEAHLIAPDPLRAVLEREADAGDDVAAAVLHDYLLERGEIH